MRLDRTNEHLAMNTSDIGRIFNAKRGIFPLTVVRYVSDYGINIFTLMAQPPDSAAKRRALQDSGTFNPRQDRVRHSLFQQSDFFDPCDLLQLKYETLRALKQEGYSIARAAADFGLSRPTIYEAKN